MPAIDEPEEWERLLRDLSREAYRRDAVPVRRVLESILELEAEGEVVNAGRLREAFARHLDEDIGPRPSGASARLWQAVRLLASPELGLPGELREDLAGALLINRLDGAVPAARRLWRRDPAEARRIALALRERDPRLAAALEDALDPRESVENPSLARARWWGRVVVGVFVISVALMVWVSKTRRPPRPSRAEAAALAREAATQALVGAAPVVRHDVGLAALRVSEDLELDNCPRALENAKELRRALDALSPSDRAAARSLVDVAEYAEESCAPAR